MNEDGDILSVTNAIQIPGREGAIISDISSVEASKIIRFSESTGIGRTTFTGRHGSDQRISDYIYSRNYSSPGIVCDSSGTRFLSFQHLSLIHI